MGIKLLAFDLDGTTIVEHWFSLKMYLLLNGK